MILIFSTLSQGQLEGEVPAHKFLLALASPVLRRGFHSSHFEENNKIDMKDTTLNAFKAMMSIMYMRPVNFKDMSVDEIFELENLAERYDLPKLKAKLKQEFEIMRLVKESVVEVAKTAMKFHLLEEASLAVLDNCAKTLNRELNTRESVVKFCASYSGTEKEVIVLKLMAMMNNLSPPPPPPCSNCQEMPCKSGTAITSVKQVRAGTVMMPNSEATAHSNWNMELRGDAVVKSIHEDKKKVIIEEGNQATKYMLSTGYYVTYNGIPVFRFHCRK